MEAKIGVFGAATLVGGALGAGTMLLQRWTPIGSGAFANCGALWAVAAFALGSRLPLRRSAWMAGGLSLVAATCSYYLVGGVVFGMHALTRLPIVWSVAGAAAGSALGLAGWVARYDSRRRSMAWAILAGSLFGEGAHLAWFTDRPALQLVGMAELTLAAVIALQCTNGSARRRLTTAVASSTAVVALLGFVLIGHVLRA